jgi:hypothetical protein
VRWRLNPFQQSIHGGPEKVIDRPAIYRHFEKRQVKLTHYFNFKKIHPIIKTLRSPSPEVNRLKISNNPISGPNNTLRFKRQCVN